MRVSEVVRGRAQRRRVRAAGSDSGTLVPAFRLYFPFLVSRKRSELLRLMARHFIEGEVIQDRVNPESPGERIPEEMVVWGAVSSLRVLASFVDTTDGIVSEVWTRPVHVSAGGQGAERAKTRFEKLNKSQQLCHNADKRYQSRTDKQAATDRKIEAAIRDIERQRSWTQEERDSYADQLAAIARLAEATKFVPMNGAS